jgi:hypothetical protein
MDCVIYFHLLESSILSTSTRDERASSNILSAAAAASKMARPSAEMVN